MRFEEVHLAYVPGHPVLRGLDLVVRPGQRVAVVGPSGSGKSTIATLLSRLRDPDGGRVLLDGHDLRDLTMASVRAQVTVVLQDSVLFATTVRDNIAYGPPGATPEQLVGRAPGRRARVHPGAAPRLRHGRRGAGRDAVRRAAPAHRHRPGRGPRLPGRRPRRGAHRAGPRDRGRGPRGPRPADRGRTTFVITHDLEAVRDADRVVRLEEGRVVARSARRRPAPGPCALARRPGGAACAPQTSPGSPGPRPARARAALDDGALAAWLGAPVRRRYLRYKPGTSCVLGLDVDGRRCFAVAYAEQAAAKLAKSAASAPRSSVLVVDEGLRALVARPSADRDLPALARLAREPRRALERALRGHDLTGAQVRVLSHKPQRRWVGRLELPTGAPVVLRAHRPEDAQATLGALRVLDGARARTPRLLGSDPRLGLVAVSWLPGTGLHELLAAGAATSTQLRATGAALAELHAGALDGLALRTPASDAEAVRRAAGAVADLLPALADQAAALAARIPAAAARGHAATGGGARRPVRRPGGRDPTGAPG